LSSGIERYPLPLLTEDWFDKRFPSIGREKIRVVDGLGENWKKLKFDSVVVVGCHADLEVGQLKHFFPVFVLKDLVDSGYSISPVIYIEALRDIGRGYHRGDIRERVAEAHKFFQSFFSPSARVLIVEDRVEIQRDIYSVLTILNFEKSLQNILKQLDTPAKLQNVTSIKLKEREFSLTNYEKELLETYLFDRRKLGTELKRYPYVSWGLEALAELSASYDIFDKSNAGLAILRKLICADHDKEYPATIVLPDPVTISGKPMRYVNPRELNPDETLFICDSYQDVSRKIYEQENVSPAFLDYLVNNIIRPFASSYSKNALDSNYDKLMSKKQMGDESGDRKLKRMISKSYWEFVKPYYNSVEMILGTHESLFIPKELTERTLEALGSKRNREILKVLASYQEKHKTSMTVNELFEKMGLPKGTKKSLWRNLEILVKSGLVNRTLEGKRLHKYNVSGNKTTIRIIWHLSKMQQNSEHNLVS